MIVNDSVDCSVCALGPPPDNILQIPPPPMPTFLLHTSSDYFTTGTEESSLPFLEHFNSSPCKHSCEWRSEGVQFVEMPQQGSFFEDTWLLILISSCVGLIFIGVVLATLFIKCRMQPDVTIHTNDDASQCSSRSNKNSTLSTSTASSGMQTTTTSDTSSGVSSMAPCISNKSTMLRLQHDAVLYPCSQDSLQDSRVMWATLTPRGTTRHYLEEHTYETIGNVTNVANQIPPPPPPGTYVTGGMFTLPPHHLQHHHHHHHHHHHQQQHQQQHRREYTETPIEHVNLKAIPTIYLSYQSDTYTEPPATSPVMTRPKDEKAFDNTAFVDYEEPSSVKNEYYQLEDVMEPSEPIQGMYQMPQRNSGTLRPRVSSPTRIEHPNLPPLNLQPVRKHSSRKNSTSQHTPDCTILRSNIASTTTTAYIPTI